MRSKKINDRPETEAQNLDASYERSFRALDQVFNRLWTGNSAGVVTSLSVIASGKVRYQQIVPALVVFALGLAAMGLASCLELVVNNSHFHVGAQSPAKGNSLPRRSLSRIALFSAFMFMSGMIWAIVLTLYILIQP